MFYWTRVEEKEKEIDQWRHLSILDKNVLLQVLDYFWFDTVKLELEKQPLGIVLAFLGKKKFKVGCLLPLFTKESYRSIASSAYDISRRLEKKSPEPKTDCESTWTRVDYDIHDGIESVKEEGKTRT